MTEAEIRQALRSADWLRHQLGYEADTTELGHFDVLVAIAERAARGLSLWWCMTHGSNGDEVSCSALGFKRTGENCTMEPHRLVPMRSTPEVAEHLGGRE